MGMGVWSRLGARAVFTLHIDVQALVTGLLAASLAAAVYNLLYQLVHPGHLLVARALQGHNLPHGLGRHAGVTVHQGLCGLREGVGDAVTEALS